MNRILKPFIVIRNNWKKSVFFSGVAAYGLNWWYEARLDDDVRFQYCQKAIEYGEKTIASAFDKNESVLVLLNRSSANQKAKTHFEKNCAPIIHLAGLEMEVQEWDGGYSDETKQKLDEIFNDPKKSFKAVLIVGGNRSSNAFLNYSTLRNRELIAKNEPGTNLVPPTAFIPVGTDSVVMSRFLSGFTGSTAYVTRLCETAFKVVSGEPETVDLLQIETADESDKFSDERPPLFAVSFFAFDKVTDLTHKSYKYWYLPGPLKRILVGLMGVAVGAFDERIIGEINAVHSFSKVVEALSGEEPEIKAQSGGSWWWPFGSGSKTPDHHHIPGGRVVKETQIVKSGEFGADYLSISANHPNMVSKVSFIKEIANIDETLFIFSLEHF